MTICIFCSNEISPETKPEHILQSALGGRKTTRGVICSGCNNLFGSTIDKGLAEQVSVVRNLLQLKSGTRNPPPTLKGVKSGKDVLDFQSDGTPLIKGEPFSVTKFPDGRFEVQVRTNSSSELAALIPHIAAQIGCSEEDLKQQIIANGRAVSVSKRPEIAPFALSFGGEESLRSIVKSCLVLWATVTGNDEVRSSLYAAAREFVNAGDASFNNGQIHLDSRDLSCANQLMKRYGKLFNLICLKSNDEGRVIAHFTLYNIVSWQVVIAESGARPNMQIALASNPLEPANWSDAIADELDIDFEWLTAPDYDLDKARARLVAMIELYTETGRSRALDQIISDALEKHTPNSGLDSQKQIMDEIIHKAALHFLGLPDEQRLSSEELQSLLGG